VTSTGAAWDYAAFRDRVQLTLDVFLAEQAGRLAPLGEDAERLLIAARTSVSGGKRFRAALCYWGFHAVAGPSVADADEKALLRACAALELLHAGALVHDDYMDASDTRRGRPTIHRSFAEEHQDDGWRGDPEQYGASTAILLGVLLLSWSHELLRHCGLPSDRVATALDVFDQCRSEVITGQFLDDSVQARGVADLDSAMTVLRYKSAKYSVERPLHIGASLACGTDSQLLRLSEFGLPLGEAFQLRDDQLGVYGDPLTTG
jgi:geranylgeranyl diphosphate synthase type I